MLNRTRVWINCFKIDKSTATQFNSNTLIDNHQRARSQPPEHLPLESQHPSTYPLNDTDTSAPFPRLVTDSLTHFQQQSSPSFAFAHLSPLHLPSTASSSHTPSPASSVSISLLSSPALAPHSQSTSLPPSSPAAARQSAACSPSHSTYRRFSTCQMYRSHHHSFQLGLPLHQP